MPRITSGGPERARKQTLGDREGRSCKHRIALSIIRCLKCTCKFFFILSFFEGPINTLKTKA